VIFERCVEERRILVTTSPRLMQRRDCPPNVYCIHPPFLSHLEVAMVHMLLTHGVELEPSTFLSRCVVCNGNIVEEHDDTIKRRILTEYEAPHALIDEGMAVYVCNGCQQGYWWNDRPTSSASRVKTAATRLLELCVRGGVPIREDDDGTDGMFQNVNYEELRKEGWNYETPGSELLRQQLDIVEWLKTDRLLCPFELESAYLDRRDNAMEGVALGEALPFTNVTHHFIDTLDYIFFEKNRLHAIERLDVPTSFTELSDERNFIDNSHLLPSDVWPSDHLAIAVRLAFLDPANVTDPVMATREASFGSMLRTSPDSQFDSKLPGTHDSIPHPTDSALPFCAPLGSAFLNVGSTPPICSISNIPGQRCSCGCIPPIKSLFEMAELRRQAKLQSMLP
jgi:Mut7-C RNAse domain